MKNAEDMITSWFASQSKVTAERFPIGIGDDMAMASIGAGGRVLITTDMLLDGVHFDLSEHTLEQVGFKAMNVNLSDCAAMATVPLCAVGASALPKGFGATELKKLHTGVQRAADAFGCPLVGGDITVWSGESERFAINITMLSEPADGVEPIRRNGAKVGDCICVTGQLGGSLAGGHLDFVPRVKEAITLARAVKINSMMDLSDGLSTDLNRMCEKSNVGALIEASRVPISHAAGRSSDPLSAALNDGEDFELLFTLGRDEYEKLDPDAVSCGVTMVGTIVQGDSVEIIMESGQKHRLDVKGYDHL